MVPNYRTTIDSLFDAGGHVLTTKAGAGHFTEAVVNLLHVVDANIGHLRKPEGRTHVVDAFGNRHAVDVILYKATGQIVDIIADAGEPGAHLAWSEGPEGEYGPSDWYVNADIQPLPQPVPVPPPVPPPAPVPPVDLGPVLAELALLHEKIDMLYRLVLATPPDPIVVFPSYAGSVSLPSWAGGSRPINLTPKRSDDSPPPPPKNTSLKKGVG